MTHDAIYRDAAVLKKRSPKEAKVVYLLNFFAPDVVSICSAWKRKVGQLVVLVSVAMEGNRSWKVDHADLDVRLQKTLTRERQDHHPGGYSDVNYVHIPLDTLRQLKKANPHVVVSAEMGMRSILAAVHCLKSGWFGLRKRRCKLVIAVSTTPWIEASRSGWLRSFQRRQLLRLADHVTFHGPECKDFLRELGVGDARMSPFHYAADPSKIYRGPLRSPESGKPTDKLVRILTVGQLIPRKGVREGLQGLIQVAQKHPEYSWHWSVLGDGPMMNELVSVALPQNLQVAFRGNCSANELKEAYREHELLFFPTLGDEWGLVVDEALHSGLAILGNPTAQSVTTLIKDEFNGWIYDPNDIQTLESALISMANRSTETRLQMREQARQSVFDRTPEASADQITEVIDLLL